MEIIVSPPADPGAKKIDEIRIYTGIGDAQMTRLGTAAFAPDRGRRGGLWPRDLPGDALPYQAQKLASATDAAAFVLAARGEGDKVSVIALGLTNGEVTSAIGTYELAVPTDYVAVYRVGLNAAVRAKPTATEPTQVELWGPPNAETCVQLVDRGGYADPRYPIAFISTPGDADCDGFAADAPEECDDHFYNGSVKPGTSTLACLGPKAIPAGMTACQVGGPVCKDGMPAASQVACSFEHRYCAMTDLCTHCKDADYADPFAECAIDPIGKYADASASRYECTVPVTSVNGTVKVCPHTLSVSFTLAASAATCTNPTFHGPAKGDGWKGRLELANGSYTLASSQAGAGPCTVTATPTNLPQDLPTSMTAGGLLALDLTAAVGIVVPFVLVAGPVTALPCEAAPVPVVCTAPITPVLQDLITCVQAPT